MQISRKILVHITILLFILFITWLSFKYNLQTFIFKQPSSSSKLTHITSSTSIPTIARVLYLFLCENQAEVDTYIKAFPSITADVMFFCWKENCVNTNFPNLTAFHTIKWSRPLSNDQPLIQSNSSLNYIMVQPRVFIINEHQLNLTNKTTWTTARNILFEKALIEEHHQGWRWAYFTFGDGDIRIKCSLPQKLLKNNQINGDEIVIAQHFRSIIRIQKSLNVNIKSDQCFILFDTFLLSVSPAIGVIGRTGAPTLFKGLLTQIVYHIDAMFNAFHRDALAFLLPYCSRYDSRTWWTSQAILVYRSLCLYGHVIQFNDARVVRQKHRTYPRHGDPWVMDEDMNLVPSSLMSLKLYMKQSRLVSALVLQHYSGWSVQMTNNDCRNRHTSVNSLTCKVGEQQNTTNSS